MTSALQESTANVDEWKRQLHSYKEENQRIKTKYLELEAAKGIYYIFLCHNYTLSQIYFIYFNKKNKDF